MAQSLPETAAATQRNARPVRQCPRDAGRPELPMQTECESDPGSQEGPANMADNPNKRGAPDRSRVSQQPHEVNYLRDKTGLPAPLIRKVIQQEGPSRQKVQTYLDRMQRNGKK
jgi:hypothetical protein